MTDAWCVNAEISGVVDGLLINGVEVAPLLQAELDRRFPERVKLRAVEPGELAEAWAMIEEIWQSTVERAAQLPEADLHERVGDEWSFVETLRHLVMATDCWLLRMVKHVQQPYHPWGLAPSFVRDPRVLGIDPSAQPRLDDVLRVRRERMDAVKVTIASLTAAELARVCVPPSEPGHPTEAHSVLECLHVILDEEWEHSRYANRDLDFLLSDSGDRPQTG
jgi:DinB superfamily